MIDWEKTKRELGYGKEDLPPTSKEKVFWKCDNPKCEADHDKKERMHTYDYALLKQEKAAKREDGLDLCQKCSHAHRKGKVSEKKTKSHLPLPPETNCEKTYELSKTLGGEPYYPEQLSPWSRNPIVLTFEGKDYEVPRANLNKYKSMIEMGCYRPVSWWTEQRRKGVKASKETREQQKLSQSKRRKREQAEKQAKKKQSNVYAIDFSKLKKSA